ncbi:MAG: hypothetical protein BYD32DRAFT_464982 [Podila humilis]|nr:MAG: hypothetical protein BYD32DRAFT_464982 [Podila humilis]
MAFYQIARYFTIFTYVTILAWTFFDHGLHASRQVHARFYSNYLVIVPIAAYIASDLSHLPERQELDPFIDVVTSETQALECAPVHGVEHLGDKIGQRSGGPPQVNPRRGGVPCENQKLECSPLNGTEDLGDGFGLGVDSSAHNMKMHKIRSTQNLSDRRNAGMRELRNI